MDVAEIAAEVVRVMFEEGVENVHLATMDVMTKRNLEFGQGGEIAKAAQKLAKAHLAKNPVLAEHLKWQYRDRSPDPRLAYFSHAHASHEALASKEA